MPSMVNGMCQLGGATLPRHVVKHLDIAMEVIFFKTRVIFKSLGSE